MDKIDLLRQTAENVRQAISRGDLPRPRRAKAPDYSAGPRAGVLRIDAGMETGELLAALRNNGKAKARQVVPEVWLNHGEPSVYMSGRACCLEAAWPKALQVERVNLSAIGQYPQTPGAFVLGPDDRGKTVTLKFTQQVTQNLLLAGMSGSGKTTTATSIVAQLARNEPGARFVIADGKGDLAHLAQLRGLVGPYAATNGEIVAALRWVTAEMARRNTGGAAKERPVYVVWDEPQDLLLNDKAQAQAFFSVVSKCRSANIHIILSTQSPKQELFGVSMTRGQFGASVCHLVRDRHESEAAIGDTEPRADHLTAEGDAYVVAPGLMERVLIAYPDSSLVDSVMGGVPDLDAWPVEYNDLPGAPCLTPEQAAAALWVAQGKPSREALRAAMATVGAAFTNADYASLRAFGAAAAAAYAVLSSPSAESDV